MSFRPTERSEGSGEINAKRFILVCVRRQIASRRSLTHTQAPPPRFVRDDTRTLFLVRCVATGRVTAPKKQDSCEVMVDSEKHEVDVVA
jgi:hypothetical protein